MIILSALEPTFEKLRDRIKMLDTFAPEIQIDFVDGKLCEGKTFLDAQKLSEIKTKAKLEIHLMVENPLDYLQTKIPDVYKICSQIEALDDNKPFINRAKQLGYIVGLSIGPDTNYEQIEQYLENLDFVQFMDIYPGAQGKEQIPQTVIKIRKFRETHPSVKIQVDGGIKVENIKHLIDAGVDDFIVGSEIIRDSNPKQKYVELTNMSELTQRNKISSLRDRKIQKIAILGGAAWEETDQTYKYAFEVCKVLAEAGYEVVNGGGPGVMRACTKGGHAGGGRVLAITYHPNKPKRHYEGVDPENDFDEEIITLDYFDRTKVMLQTTQLHIVFKGSLGTLSEFGMSWVSSWIHEPDSKPVILYGSFWNDFLGVIDKHLNIHQAEKDILKVCSTPEEVLEYVRKFD